MASHVPKTRLEFDMAEILITKTFSNVHDLRKKKLIFFDVYINITAHQHYNLK